MILTNKCAINGCWRSADTMLEHPRRDGKGTDTVFVCCVCAQQFRDAQKPSKPAPSGTLFENGDSKPGHAQ